MEISSSGEISMFGRSHWIVIALVMLMSLASAALRYYPLRTSNGIVGVMGIQPEEQRAIIRLEQERLIAAFASQTALAIERIEFWKQICRTEKITDESSSGKIA